MLAALILTIAIESPLPPPVRSYEEIADLRITPAVPGGQPFDQPIDLPQAPEPGALLLMSGAVVLLGRRHGR